MEVEGNGNKMMKSMMGKEVDKKLKKAKAKEEKEKKEKGKLFRRRQNPSTGAHKNWSEWRKKHERRWKRKTALIKKEMEQGFLQQERTLLKKECPSTLSPLARRRVIPQPRPPSQKEPPQVQQRRQPQTWLRQQPSPLHPEEECEIPSRRTEGTRPWRTRPPRRVRRSRRCMRRIQKRARLKELSWESRLHAHHLHIAEKKIELYKTEIKNLYGYCADGILPLWKNKENCIDAMTPAEYLSWPTNMACHNLFLENPMPQGTRRLLGLGLKFCTPRVRSTSRINRTLERVTQDIMLKDGVFKVNPPKERKGVHYIPQLYLHREHWIGPKNLPKTKSQQRNSTRVK